MGTACHCGMTLEHGGPRAGCAECGTEVCPSCRHEFDSTTYCRWCATTNALARPA
jgi:hypothetical protein